MKTISIWIIMMIAGTVCAAPSPDTKPLPRLIAEIPLEGVAGRIDHMAVTAKGKQLVVAALGNNTVETIDLAQNKQSARIDGIQMPQGVCLLPQSGNWVLASGQDGRCRIYDPNQKLLGAIDGLDDADNVRYDPAARRIYLGYGDGALAVIDPEKPAKLADIKLDGHPESFQLEAKGKRLFVNVPTAGHIAVIDRDKQAVTGKWPIANAKANFPMALDEPNRRLFVACRNPARLLVLETGAGKIVATLDCCGDTDDVFYDPAEKRVYVAGGEGCVTVFDQAGPDAYKLAGKITTPSGARTALFAPDLHRLFVAVPKKDQRQSAILVFETQTKTP
jgi:DNA-binding beta-propeller fold protein YncE